MHLSPSTYLELLDAQKQAYDAHLQFRRLLQAAGYEEYIYNFINGRIIIAIHPELCINGIEGINSWRLLREWCQGQPDEAYFIVEGEL